VEKYFIFWREKQSAISETYGNNTRMHVTHQFEICTLSLYMYSICPQCLSPRITKCLIKGIIRTVTEAYESHRLLEDLRRKNGMGKNTSFLSICILFILPYLIINKKDLLKTCLIFNCYAHKFSCKNDWNNFLLLNTNPPLIGIYECCKFKSS